jgi:large subunit ribosomal protein L4
VGDRKSPIRKGGGVAHGPVDRDHSTGLPRKIYDRAWRTALSYRYRQAQLIVVDGKLSDAWQATQSPSTPEAIIHLHQLFKGKNPKLTTLYIGLEGNPDKMQDALHQTLEEHSPKDRVRYVYIDTDEKDVRGRPKRERFVDVKNLLESHRIVIEKPALDRLLTEHQSDLGPLIDPAKAKEDFEKDAPAMAKAMAEFKAARDQETAEKTAEREQILAGRKKRKSEKRLKLDLEGEAQSEAPKIE